MTKFEEPGLTNFTKLTVVSGNVANWSTEHIWTDTSDANFRSKIGTIGSWENGYELPPEDQNA